MENYPMIIVVAKFDNKEKNDYLTEYIDEICFEVEDEFGVDIKIDINKQGDKIFLPIKFNQSKEYNEDMSFIVNDVSERIKDFLKTEGKNVEYKIKFEVEGPFFYYGESGRFGNCLKDAAKKYTRDYDDNSYVVGAMYNSQYNCFNISRLVDRFGNIDKECPRILLEDDIKVLLSDIDNCSSSGSTDQRKVDKIMIHRVDIVFYIK
jgi:hypothetical protein